MDEFSCQTESIARNSARKPNDIDIHVGGRISLRRKALGQSQESLAQALNITFQQLQKYERGVNRVSASRLYELSILLGVTVSFFFEDLYLNKHSVNMLNSTQSIDSAAEMTPSTTSNSLRDQDLVSIVEAYRGISSEQTRMYIRMLMNTLRDK